MDVLDKDRFVINILKDIKLSEKDYLKKVMLANFEKLDTTDLDNTKI